MIEQKYVVTIYETRDVCQEVRPPSTLGDMLTDTYRRLIKICLTRNGSELI